MPDVWVFVAIAAAIPLLIGLRWLSRRQPAAPAAFADEREERLTRQLAQTVGCRVEQALPALQGELRLAPGQSDETLLKRAAYHYRQALPESECRTYRDRAVG